MRAALDQKAADHQAEYTTRSAALADAELRSAEEIRLTAQNEAERIIGSAEAKLVEAGGQLTAATRSAEKTIAWAEQQAAQLLAAAHEGAGTFGAPGGDGAP